MLRLDGTQITQKRKDGKPLMVARLVYAEPEFFDLCDRLGKSKGTTRSTMFRIFAKSGAVAVPARKNIVGINWNESVN